MVKVLNNLEDIELEQFRDPDTWKDLQYILHAHPNPVTRHEACFVAGELKIEDLIPGLKEAAIGEKSLVVRHEAIEALGRIGEQGVHAVDDFLASLQSNKNHDPLLEHPDIVATLETARRRLVKITNAPQNIS